MRRELRAAERRLKFPRDMRRTAFQMYAGRYAFPDGHKQKIGLNLINRGVNVLTPHMMANNPDVDIEPLYPQLRGEAAMHNVMIRHQLHELKHKRMMRLVLQDALLGPFCPVRVGIRANEDVVVADEGNIPLGMPYYKRIDFDDFAFDASARDAEEVQWEAERWRVPREVALDLGWLGDPDKVAQMSRVGHGGDESHSGVRTALEWVSREQAGEEFEGSDMVEFWDIMWKHADGSTSIHVMPADRSFDEYVHEYDWQGPNEGPVLRLEFTPVSAQPYGMSWVSQAREQAEDLSKLQAKFVEQALRSKRVLIANKGNEDDLLEIEDAPDGGSIVVSDVNSVDVAEYGGTSDAVVEAMVTLQSWWDAGAGQIDEKAGQGKGKRTATEASMMQANARVLSDDMQATFDEFQDGIVGFLGWSNSTDPLIQKPIGVRSPGGEQVVVQYDAETRRGGFPDFMWRIRRRSTMHQNPEIRIQRMMELSQVIAQFAQLQMMGVPVDTLGAARNFGREADLPWISEVVMDPMQAQFEQMLLQNMQGAMGQQPQMAPVVNAQPGGGQSMLPPGGGPGNFGSQTHLGQTRSALAPMTPGGPGRPAQTVGAA